MQSAIGSPPSPEEMADRLAIIDILHLHSRGLDRLDVAALQHAYWPDATVDYGMFKGAAHDFAPLVVGALEGGYELTRHSLSNVSIAVNGEDARSEAWVHAGHLLPGASEELLFYGRYLDQLVRREGQWKIQHRQVVVEWIKRHTVVDERNSEAFNDLTRGTRGSADPLYAHFASLLGGKAGE